jgi:hypothetical protein
MAEHPYTEADMRAYLRRKRNYMLRKGYVPPDVPVRREFEHETPVDPKQALWQFVLWAIVVPVLAVLCAGLVFAISRGIDAIVTPFA